MANKFIRVNIKYKGFIPILGCFGPVQNILLTETQVNNIKRIIGEDKVELSNKPKRVIPQKKVEEPRKDLITRHIKKEEIAEIIEVKPQPVEEPKPEPKKVEEPVQEVVEEVKPQPVEEPKPMEEPVQEVVEEVKPAAPKRRGGRKPAPKKVEEPVQEVVEGGEK